MQFWATKATVSMLILVRHAMPAFRPDVAAHDWTLSEASRAAAADLVKLFPKDSVLVASAEAKAFQTLQPAGEVLRDERFNEVWRNGEPWDGNYLELRRAYVEGTDHASWEPRADVVERFDQGITDQLANASDRPVVVASHGMAMTIWLTSRIGLHDPGTFWADLDFPDAYRVDLQARAVTRIRPRSSGA